MNGRQSSEGGIESPGEATDRSDLSKNSTWAPGGLEETSLGRGTESSSIYRQTRVTTLKVGDFLCLLAWLSVLKL